MPTTLTQEITKRKLSIPAILAALFFLLLAAEMANDPLSYVKPRKTTQAESSLKTWEILSGLSRPGAKTPEPSALRAKFLRHMTSPLRFQVHRGLLGSMFILYLLSAFGFWREKGFRFKTAGAAFILKILHALFFIGMGYYGKTLSSSYFKTPPPSLLVLTPSETHYALGLLLAALCLLYLKRTADALSKKPVTAEIS